MNLATVISDMPAQSDDLYERIGFRRLADGCDVAGTVGWREGAENRVVFTVWDGPSFAACGATLAESLQAAMDGIRGEGHLPLIAAALPEPPADPHSGLETVDGDRLVLTQADPVPAEGHTPRFEPLLWLAAALILLAILLPVIVRAEIPEPGKMRAFPNAPYYWRYDGPDFDPSSASDRSAVRLRALAAEAGRVADDLDPVISVFHGESDAPVARYVLDVGTFCDHEDENCEMDGIFPFVLGSDPDEPILAVVTHSGPQGQRLSVLRPERDASAPVFEAAADYAISIRLLPGGLYIEMENADVSGNIRRHHQMWLAGDGGDCEPAARVGLTDPPPPSQAAAALENELRRIARERDLSAFVDLLAEDVLVSFGGDGGKQEFLSSLDYREGGEAAFWETLERLLAQGGWSEPDTPETMTWPWFFAAWPSAEEPYDALLSNPGTILRAGPDPDAPVLAQLPFDVLRFAPPEPDDAAIDWESVGWLPVATPEHCLGYVAAGDVTPLLGHRLVARGEAGRWYIEAFVAGD